MGKFKCAGCFKEIDYNLGNSLCYDCFDYLCNTKVSYEDPPTNEGDDNGKEETDIEGTIIKDTLQEKDAGTI